MPDPFSFFIWQLLFSIFNVFHSFTCIHHYLLFLPVIFLLFCSFFSLFYFWFILFYLSSFFLSILIFFPFGSTRPKIKTSGFYSFFILLLVCNEESNSNLPHLKENSLPHRADTILFSISLAGVSGVLCMSTKRCELNEVCSKKRFQMTRVNIKKRFQQTLVWLKKFFQVAKKVLS